MEELRALNETLFIGVAVVVKKEDERQDILFVRKIFCFFFCGDLFSLFGCVTCAFDLDEVLREIFFESNGVERERKSQRRERRATYTHNKQYGGEYILRSARVN